MRNNRKSIVFTALFTTPRANASGHSPCFNRIEQDFAVLEKRRIYSASDISLDDIVKSYENYLE